MKNTLAAIALSAAALPVAAQDVAGEFDYYVLALSWSPTWCAMEGLGRDEPQCDAGRRTGFTVHGLWPQYERGWPDWCETAQRDPTRRESAAMADVMPSGGLAWYQWQKHGRCSGLSGPEYYKALREAALVADVPVLFEMLPRDVTLSADVIEDAFIETIPGMTPEGITVTCDAGHLDEVRICLTREFEPRDCAPDIRRDCRGPMLMQAPR